jgi:hypothetical protein
VLTTYSDMIAHLTDYLGGNATKEASRDARRAILNAYREIASAHPWSYYYSRLHLTTVAPYSTGTIAYTQTGGTYERMVVLTGGTWPAWAAYGQIVLDNIVYEVAELKDSVTLTLGIDANPGADIAALSPYLLYRDKYPLPGDFISMDELIVTSIPVVLRFVHPRDWLTLQRILHTPANMRWYCCTGDPDFQGVLCTRFYPPPDQVYQVDGIYRRRPRPLVIDNYATGTASLTSASATVTGSGTSWSSRMIGSVFRIGFDATEAPTGNVGGNPAAVEQIVVDVASATSLTLDSVATESLTDAAYSISDPVDIEGENLFTAFLRCCEKQEAISRIMENQAAAKSAYLESLVLAREADSRSFAPRVAGQGGVGIFPLKDFPLRFDVT